MDHLCYLCLVFFMLSRLFIAALWPPDLLALVCVFNCVFVYFPFGIMGLLWYLIVSIPVFAAFPTYIIRLNRQKKFKPELIKWHSC